MSDRPNAADLASANLTAQRPKPNSRWVCGYQHLGIACEEGPSEAGTCCQVEHGGGPDACHSSECEQSCTGSGNCEVSKLRHAAALPSHRDLGPCTPLKSTWFSRKTIALNSAILVGGLLLLCMAIPQREAIFVPGALSQKHSQILANTLVSQRCSLCHPNSHPDQPAGLVQDDLCMKCHDTHMPDAALRSPHDLTKGQLDTLTVNVSSHNETSCAMCHREHHGSQEDITAIADARCQACHSTQFSSLASGHPQFGDYPYRTERRIAFDHVAHQNKHFAQKNETFDCSRCHFDESKEGAVGSVFRTVGFDAACASCHAQSIRAATVEGWALLQLPSIDPQDAADPALGLSDWPSESKYDYDGKVTVAMRLLLASDPDVASAIEKLPASSNLGDVVIADRADVSRSIAAGFRRLVTDIAINGQAAWTSRLTDVAKQVLRRPLNENEMSLILEMSAGLPPDLFREIELHWFGTGDNLAGHERSNAFRLVGNVDNLLDGADDAATTTEDDLLSDSDDDFSQSSDGAIGDYTGDDADALLFGDLNGEPTQRDNLSGPDSGLRVLTKLRGVDHVTQGGWYLDKEIMAVRYMPRGHGDRMLAAWAEFTTIIQGTLLSAPHEAPSRSKNRMPTGDTHRASHNLATVLSLVVPSQAIPGGCTECHLVGNQPDSNVLWSNWKSISRPQSARTFTKFDHTPHLTLPTVNDCRYCHVFRANRSQSLSDVLEHGLAQRGGASRAWRDRFVATHADVSEYLHSEFVPMKRSQCIACHGNGGANDGCTQCHNYHVGSNGFRWSNASDRNHASRASGRAKLHPSHISEASRVR